MAKKRELTDQQKEFLSAMSDAANKGNIRKCMNLAGYSESVRTGWIVSVLSEELVEVASKMMAGSAVKAAANMDELLDEPGNLHAKTIVSVANSILDRAGLGKKDKGDISVKVPGGGLLILPAKQLVEEDGVVNEQNL